jgi:hypothetical protein
MIVLHFVDRKGDRNANQWHIFNVSKGHCETACNHVVKELTNLLEEFIHRPNAEERKQISWHRYDRFQIPNSVGMMDGTLMELGLTTHCDDTANYGGRKLCYSLIVGIINDGKRRI